MCQVYFIVLMTLLLCGHCFSLRSEVFVCFICPKLQQEITAMSGSLLSSGTGPSPKRSCCSYPFSMRASRWLSMGRTCPGGTSGCPPCPVARSRKLCMPTSRAAL